MALKAVQIVAIVLTALCVVPSGAHLAALPNKIGLAPDAYFMVQGIYRGWSLFGIVLFGALFANAVLTVRLRGQGASFWLAFAGFAGIAATLAIFFAWTYPANLATQNWTAVPPDWAALRDAWEYSHAVNAIIGLAALICVVLSMALHRDSA